MCAAGGRLVMLGWTGHDGRVRWRGGAHSVVISREVLMGYQPSPGQSSMALWYWGALDEGVSPAGSRPFATEI